MDICERQDAAGACEAPGSGGSGVCDRLLTWFDEYNATLFDPPLPRIEVRLARLDYLGVEGHFHPHDRLIEVSDMITEDEQRAALLHEMVHLWQSCNGQALSHGKRFMEWRTSILELIGLRI